MALVASGVGLSPDLAQTLQGIGTSGYNQINQNYTQARQRAANTNAVNGLPPTGPSSYSTQRLNAQQGLDQGNLNASLGQGLGSTAYQNQLQLRDFGQQSQIANEVGAAAAPAALQQIFAGIGTGANAITKSAPAVSALYNSYNSPTDPNAGNPNVNESGVAYGNGYGASGYDPDYGYYYQ
jgi:hypothetical protein